MESHQGQRQPRKQRMSLNWRCVLLPPLAFSRQAHTEGGEAIRIVSAQMATRKERYDYERKNG